MGLHSLFYADFDGRYKGCINTNSNTELQAITAVKNGKQGYNQLFLEVLSREILYPAEFSLILHLQNLYIAKSLIDDDQRRSI